MSKENELSRYKEFINMHFPSNVWSSKQGRIKSIGTLHSVAYDNMILIEVFQDWIEEQDCQCHKEFLNNYKEYINSILIAIPVNHVGFVGYLIRSAVESLLKLLYSIAYPEKEQETIARTAFRNLKDELKEAYKAKGSAKLPQLAQLFSLYGTYSKEVHAHVTNNSNALGTLDYYIENYFEKMNHSVKDVKTIFKLFIELICEAISFNALELTLASSLRLERNLDPEIWAIIKS
ncbi:hypothetical protein MMB75_15820 [Paenibacillus sp. P2(2022)]|uniref:hypothetical protein n=1 Tax=Paenibacillus TaxID=44249 RepID=UPI00030BD553|nr:MULTISPECIES: hypothetical protein [Paenibacillus]MDG0055150.1 hypothetical protein [Paenibacillus sp. P2(2022)]MDN4076486.1 hypothetical protein [Paenibacillus polymyxa]MDN4086439.1 hypothetical protein [Paenibacillus polymyxa]MDN4101912.1 hypothetical protein [Paenibacillus polymyxa]MDN4112129.1 hypothetical protein [Paenibacillus polymyxa]